MHNRSLMPQAKYASQWKRTLSPVFFSLVLFAWIAMSIDVHAQSLRSEMLPRSWKSKDGKFSTRGTIVELVEDKVKIRKEDGKTADVPIDRLSTADRSYIKDIIRVDSSAEVSMGRVSKILKDNSIEFIDIDGAALSVRLDGVDFNEASLSVSQHLRSTLLGHFCWIESKIAKGEGLSGVVYVQGSSVNLDLIAKGFVKYDPLSKLDPRFARAEKYAAAKRLGVWGK